MAAPSKPIIALCGRIRATALWLAGPRVEARVSSPRLAITRSISKRLGLLGRSLVYRITKDPKTFNDETWNAYLVRHSPLHDAIPETVQIDLGSSGFDATPYVRKVEVLGASVERWDYGMDNPEISVAIQVTHPRWLAHLKLGRRQWGSVAYDSEALAPVFDLHAKD